MNNRISIITICFNNLPELLETCLSVEKQSVFPFEHIIVDGSSNSEIREYLEKTTLAPYVKWISERDNGIADAFNKGIKLSSGDIVNMLNSGDCFLNTEVLVQVSAAFQSSATLMWIHGKYQIERGGQMVTLGKPFEPGKLYRGMRSLCHQTMFVKKSLHEKYGLYNPEYSISMDYDFVCRIYKEPFSFSQESCIKMAPGGISTAHYLKSLEQSKKVYQSHFGKSVLLNLWQLRLKILFHLLQTKFGKLLFSIKRGLGMENV
jgi:glycosyltransferase involved in cell wall biosynthesis